MFFPYMQIINLDNNLYIYINQLLTEYWNILAQGPSIAQEL